MTLLNKILNYFNSNMQSNDGSKYRHDHEGTDIDRFSPELRKWVSSKREEEQQAAENRLRKSELDDIEDRKNIESMTKSLRKARKSDYDDWLSKYINAGGEPTHWYDYPWNRWNGRDCSWFIANKDIVLYPLYGAKSIHIIVPAGIKCYGDPGHTNLFRYDDIGKPPGKYECRFVPVFCDSEA